MERGLITLSAALAIAVSSLHGLGHRDRVGGAGYRGSPTGGPYHHLRDPRTMVVWVVVAV
jgi:hypothetical protein